MPQVALLQSSRRYQWARPGGIHDHLIRMAAIVTPILATAVVASMLVMPLRDRGDFNFLLSKDRVDTAHERMRVSEAVYRGFDNRGQPFSVSAGQAVQHSSRLPVFQIQNLSARMGLKNGPAILRAPAAQLNSHSMVLVVTGPLLIDSADGFRLFTRDVSVNLNARTMTSDKPVEGQMRIGNFSADRMVADLDQQTVTLQGNARLHINGGASR